MITLLAVLKKKLKKNWYLFGLMSKRIWSQPSSGVDLQFDNCRVKWLIYNAVSPVAFAESIVASQDHQRKGATKSKFTA